MRRHSRMRSSRGGVPSDVRCYMNISPRSRTSWPCAATFTNTSHVCARNAVNRAGSSGAASKQSARVVLERADAASQPIYARANRRSRRGTRGRSRGPRISTSISPTSAGVRILLRAAAVRAVVRADEGADGRRAGPGSLAWVGWGHGQPESSRVERHGQRACSIAPLYMNIGMNSV